MNHLQMIRQFELNLVLPLIQKGSAVLDIGSGPGFQAKLLTEAGFSVKAVDVELPALEFRQCNVEKYDGRNLPFSNASFDVVFSSNALEHIPHIREFQEEIRRVLKPDGMAIHILPSAPWRFWSLITHYLFVAKAACFLVLAKMSVHMPDRGPRSTFMRVQDSFQRKNKWTLLKDSLFAPRHGETGNALTELFTFSRFYWIPLFRKTKWRLVQKFPNQLFYTGYSILGECLTLNARTCLSPLLGSACNIYVLEPRNEGN